MNKKILSIDDSKTIRLIIRRALRPYDCTVCEAANGEEGLVAAAAAKPDLIILDITMPVMDGVTMLMKLKEDEALKNIPVVMLTAESGRDNVAYIAKLGVSAYLVKPFQDQQLIDKLKGVIELQSSPAVAVPV